MVGLAALRAASPTIAAIHFELAYSYLLLSEGITRLVPHKRAANG